jgi:hypothetical protein
MRYLLTLFVVCTGLADTYWVSSEGQATWQQGQSARARVWSGADICRDRSKRGTQPSTHNWVHHCHFFRWVWKGDLPNRGALLDIGEERTSDRDRIDASTHNRIEDNVFAYGGHHTLGVFSQFNVVRRNYIHNETNPEQWPFPGYRGAITQGMGAGRSLFEHNRIAFADQAGMGLRSHDNIYRFNQFYQNGYGGLQIVSNAVGKDTATLISRHPTSIHSPATVPLSTTSMSAPCVRRHGPSS